MQRRKFDEIALLPRLVHLLLLKYLRLKVDEVESCTRSYPTNANCVGL